MLLKTRGPIGLAEEEPCQQDGPSMQVDSGEYRGLESDQRNLCADIKRKEMGRDS